MCSMCEVTETGFCFCGTSMDPEGRTDQCGVKGSSGHCDTCGHDAAAQPMDTSQHGSDYTEL
jgi:hypothetical protein